MSSLRNPPWWQLPSCSRDVRTRSKMAAPIRSSQKHHFFIKITISQYHDIDISYIDIDIGKNAFSMTSLHLTAQIYTKMNKKVYQITKHNKDFWFLLCHLTSHVAPLIWLWHRPLKPTPTFGYTIRQSDIFFIIITEIHSIARDNHSIYRMKICWTVAKFNSTFVFHFVNVWDDPLCFICTSIISYSLLVVWNNNTME